MTRPSGTTVRDWLRIWFAALPGATAISIYFVLEALLFEFQANNGQMSQISPTVWAGTITWFVWALLAPLLLSMFSRYPPRDRTALHTVLIYLAAGAGFSVIHGVIETPLWLMAIDAPPPLHHGALLRVIWWTALRAPSAMIQFAVFAVVYHMFAIARELRVRHVAAAQADALLAQAELKSLRAQLEPHFLFNTLNAIAGSIRQAPERAEEMLGRLSRLLREMLRNRDQAYSALRDEVAFIREYLMLHQVRFENRLQITIDVDDAVSDALIPAHLLQPLVENAVRHGIERRPGKGSIRLSASRAGAGLRITVADDALGATFDEVSHPMPGAGLGLANVRARMQHLYGDAARLDVQSRAAGTTVVLALPLAVPQ